MPTNEEWVSRSTVAVYIAAAAALPLVAYVSQPPDCFRYLYLPAIVVPFALLALTVGAVQSSSRLRATHKLALSFAFAVGISSTVTTPCFLGMRDKAPFFVRFPWAALSLGWVAGIAILATVAGLLLFRPSSRHKSAGRYLAALGLALASVALIAGVTAQYSGMTSPGSGEIDAVPKTETRVVVFLTGLVLGILGCCVLAADRVRRLRSPRAKSG
jgi:hypothetical protein